MGPRPGHGGDRALRLADGDGGPGGGRARGPGRGGRTAGKSSGQLGAEASGLWSDPSVPLSSLTPRPKNAGICISPEKEVSPGREPWGGWDSPPRCFQLRCRPRTQTPPPHPAAPARPVRDAASDNPAARCGPSPPHCKSLRLGIESRRRGPRALLSRVAGTSVSSDTTWTSTSPLGAGQPRLPESLRRAGEAGAGWARAGPGLLPWV